MNWIFSFLSFISLIALAKAQAEVLCGANEIHSCVRYCKRTCLDIGKAQCAEVPGCSRKTCHCKDGFYLNEVKECVPQDQCPSINKSGVLPSADSAAARVAMAVQSVLCVFERCTTTTSSPRQTTTTTTATPRINNAGCLANQERVSCGTPCEPTCLNPTPVCARSCLVNVCQCRSGFYRDGNRCIRPSECPAYQPGSVATVATATSAPTVNVPPMRLRPYIPDHRPYYGMVTNYQNCPATEIYAVCIPCERTCDSTNWLCHDYCVDGCTCDQVRGYYYRDRSTGKCVNRCPVYNTYSYNYWQYQPAQYVPAYYAVPRRGDLFETFVVPFEFGNDELKKTKRI